MSPYLFVYGTLLSTARHPMGDRLRRESAFVGQATIPGRLYRVSRYPGLLAEPNSATQVMGEVYKLNSPQRSLHWLDAYEGIEPNTVAGAEYERAERTVDLASGEQIAAWVYLYLKPVSRLQLIPDGRWIAVGEGLH